MQKLFTTFLIWLFFCTGAVYAGEQAFTQTAFQELQQQHQPMLVDIHADWCPTCRAQTPVITKLLNTPAFQHIHWLKVDFDQQQDVVKNFNVSKQSTLIVFKDGKEVARSLGQTSEAAIAALLKQAL